MGVDPIAEQFPHVSTYNYAENEPIGHIDLWGLQAATYEVSANTQDRKSLNEGRAESGAFSVELDAVEVVGEKFKPQFGSSMGIPGIINKPKSGYGAFSDMMSEGAFNVAAFTATLEVKVPQAIGSTLGSWVKNLMPAAAKTSTTALRKVGSVLESVDDVMANPSLLKGKSPLQVEGILGKTPGWKVETLGQGSQKGNGWVLRQYNAKGNPTGPQLRWHPGGGHHGPTPYWRVVGPNGDLGGIIR